MSVSSISPRLLRVRQAATYLAVSSKRIRALVLNGELAFVQLGRGNSPLLLDVHDLDRFIEAHKNQNR